MSTSSTYEQTIKLGEVPGTEYGYKRALPVEIEVKITADGRLSMVGCIWKPNKSDWVGGGQNYGEIAGLFPDDARVQRIVEVWERWHLNDMRAGCEHQRDGKRHEIGEICPIDGYSYGSAWLREELPAEIIEEVKSWSSEES